MRENTVSECLPRVRDWLSTVPSGTYASAELLAMFPGSPPARNVFGYALRACGAKLCKSRGVRCVVIPDALTVATLPPMVGRPANAAPPSCVLVRLSAEQAAWVRQASRRQGNSAASVIRVAIDAAMGTGAQ